MTNALQRVIGVLCAGCIVVAGHVVVRGDEPDVEFVQQQTKQLRSLGKDPFPIYSKTAGNGMVKVEPGNRASWNDDAAVFLGDLGWTCDSSINVWDGIVFVNVGPSVVKVGSLELEKGAYCEYGSGTFQKKTFAELAGKSSNLSTAALRQWNDATGNFSTVAVFVEVNEGKAVLRKTDGSVIRVLLERLSDRDLRYIDSLVTSDPKAEQESNEEVPASQMSIGRERTSSPSQDVIANSQGTQERLVDDTSADDSGKGAAKWPALRYSLGRDEGLRGRPHNTLRVINPYESSVRVGLRLEGGYGRDFIVPARLSREIDLPNGVFHVYFRFDDEPDNVYLGDDLRLFGFGSNVSLRLRSAVEGNYSIRQVD